MMKRRESLGWAGALLLAWAAPAWAVPSPAEQSRIDRLIDAVAKRKDVRFIRNGSEYSAENAADFLRRKLKAHEADVATADDFIDKIASRSSTSGQPYHVRLPDGRTVASAEFLRQELARIEAKG